MSIIPETYTSIHQILRSSPTDRNNPLELIDDIIFFHDNGQRLPLYHVGEDGFLYFTEKDGSHSAIYPDNAKPPADEDKDSYIAISNRSTWLHTNGHTHAVVYRPDLPLQEVHMTKKHEPFSGTYLKTLFMPHSGLIASSVLSETGPTNKTGFKNALAIPVSRSEATNFLHQAFWDGLQTRKYMALSVGGKNCSRYVNDLLQKRTNSSLTDLSGINQFDFSPGHFIHAFKKYAHQNIEQQKAEPAARIFFSHDSDKNAEIYHVHGKNGAPVLYIESNSYGTNIHHRQGSEYLVDPSVKLLFEQLNDLSSLKGDITINFNHISREYMWKEHTQRVWSDRKIPFYLIGQNTYDTSAVQGPLKSRKENNLFIEFYHAVHKVIITKNTPEPLPEVQHINNTL